MSIAELIITLPLSLTSLAELIYDTLFRSFNTPIGNLSLFAIIFGAGFIVLIGIRIVRLFLP
jgi:hypothetical protein